jgi:hypothetical protein
MRINRRIDNSRACVSAIDTNGCIDHSAIKHSQTLCHKQCRVGRRFHVDANQHKIIDNEVVGQRDRVAVAGADHAECDGRIPLCEHQISSWLHEHVAAARRAVVNDVEISQHTQRHLWERRIDRQRDDGNDHNTQQGFEHRPQKQKGRFDE